MTSPEKKAHSAEILLVEDNPVDVIIVQKAFGKCTLRNNIHIAEDGEQAMDFLYKRGKFSSVRSPDIILLDLNVPKKHGLDILCEIKQNESLRRIPVFILTTSEDPEDIRRSYELEANCFITKPSSMEEFTMALESMMEFWFSIVKLPTPTNS